MNARLLAAVSAAKIAKILIRISGGGATAAPGLLAEYIDPQALRKLSKYYDGAALITGTNGKTTTARILGNLLERSGIYFIHNRSGSNLLRGLIGTLAEGITLYQKRRALALLEVDEFTLPSATNSLDPKIIVFNNLFRDQLDRYGEIDTIRKVWQNSLVQIDNRTVLVLNSDDHSVAHLAAGTRAKVIYFGIEDAKMSIGKLPHASDFTSCITCGTELRFDHIYLSHLGKYKCTTCGLKRPHPDVYAKKIFLDEERGFTAEIVTPKGSLTIKIGLPGIFNVYNTLAAIAAGLALGVKLEAIKKSLRGTRPVFGRTELISVGDKKLYFNLVKNPAGFNEILRLLRSSGKRKDLFIAINDRLADGRDVSWLWDVDFENIMLSRRVRKIWVSGIRANDMLLRIKYANHKLKPTVIEDIETALERAADELPRGETLYILPTYTAMLAIKKMLADRGYNSQFWQD